MILRRDEYDVLYNVCKGKFSGGSEEIVSLLERQGLVKKQGGKVIETIKGLELLKDKMYTRWFLEMQGFRGSPKRSQTRGLEW
jgi:hypothetical protein